MQPCACLRARSFPAKTRIRRSVSATAAIASACCSLPLNSAFTSSYTSRALLHVMVRAMRSSTTRPASSISISAVIVNLSSFGRSEQTPLQSCSGSIGSTRPGR